MEFSPLRCATARWFVLILAALAIANLLPRTASAQTTYAEQILYRFCSQANCSDGDDPMVSRLVVDAAGNLYGTTYHGGTSANGCLYAAPIGCGVVFRLSPDGRGGWAYSVLHTFCSESNCADGANLEWAVVIDTQGNLYGTAQGGGNRHAAGVAFRLSPNANGYDYLQFLFEQ